MRLHISRSILMFFSLGHNGWFDGCLSPIWSTLTWLAWSAGTVATLVSTIEGEPLRRSSVFSGLLGPVSDNLREDSTRHTVVQLCVQLGKGVAGIHGSLSDVSDHELPDGLILGADLGAVSAPDELDMATAVLVASSVTTLEGHFHSLVEVNQAILAWSWPCQVHLMNLTWPRPCLL